MDVISELSFFSLAGDSDDLSLTGCVSDESDTSIFWSSLFGCSEVLSEHPESAEPLDLCPVGDGEDLMGCPVWVSFLLDLVQGIVFTADEHFVGTKIVCNKKERL